MALISRATQKRLPVYISYLKSLDLTSEDYISSGAIAKALGLGEVLVRKDLAEISGGGKPKKGHNALELLKKLEDFLGGDKTSKAVIVGTGKLGKALLEYEGFSKYGLEVICGFDISPQKCAKPIYHTREMQEIVKTMGIEIGVLTVPAIAAQAACDMMVKSGIKAILNFTPAVLTYPEDVIVSHENLASSLALLATRLKKR